jgi:hypothetical protein
MGVLQNHKEVDVEKPRDQKRSYGRNWRKWLLIYLAVGAVLYLVIFLILQGGGGSSGGGLY